MNLYEMTARIDEILNELVHNSEETDTNIQDLHDELDALHKTRESKLEAYVHVIKNAEATATAAQAEATAFQARARALKNLAQNLKDNLQADLQQHSEKTATAGAFKIARQKSPAHVVVECPAEHLTAEFLNVKITPNKTAIKTAIEAGEEMPEGVRLVESEHIRIRVR